MNGIMALAKVTHSGLSGDVFAKPTEPPLRTYETGSSSHSRMNSGAAMNSAMLPNQAGDDRVRNVAVDGRSR